MNNKHMKGGYCFALSSGPLWTLRPSHFASYLSCYLMLDLEIQNMFDAEKLYFENVITFLLG